MFSLVGRDEIIRNVYRLAHLHNPDGDLTQFESLRSGYLSLLAEKQPHMQVNFTSDPFIRDPDVEDALANAFDVDVALNDLDQDSVVGRSYDKADRHARLDKAQSALNELLDHDDDLRLIFELTVHSIFSKQCAEQGSAAHGGSSSGAIGAVWMSLRDSITHNDMKEMYVHELTHTLLFIDELNYEQFDYAAIAKPENFARSAVLLKNRPLDKVVHSIVVGTEVLLARRNHLGEPADLTVHPASEILAQNTLIAMDSLFGLENIHDLTSDRLLGLAQQCGEVCKTFLPEKVKVAS